jgi:hypothetical protein
MLYDSENKSNKYNQKKSLNDTEDLKIFAKNLVSDKEKQIKIASSLLGKDISGRLRTELSEIRNKYSQFLEDDSLLNPDPMEQADIVDNTTNNINVVPNNEQELNDILFNSIADSFTTVINENNEPVFSVNFTDQDTIVIEYSSEKGGTEEDPFTFQNLQQFMKPIFDIIDKVGFGEEDPESKKQSLVNSLKEPMEMYRDSLETIDNESDSKKGKKNLIYKRSDESMKMASQIYDILKNHGLAGPIADKNYEEIVTPNDGGNNTMTGEQVMEAKNKSFNLKKKSAKLFDTIREKPIQQSDPQYQSVHGDHALPWYEEAYIPEDDYKKNIMDKYYPEQLNADGEYRGGYINDRFVVHHNTEGNSMHVKPGTRQAPDRVESYSTERRMEEMRKKDKRGYKPSEGSKTEQQTNEVLASKDQKIIVSEDFGLYKVVCGSKTTYLDTPQQVEAFKEIKMLLDEEQSSKKKIAQTFNLSQSPASANVGVNTLDREGDANVSPENPLPSLVNAWKSQPGNEDASGEDIMVFIQSKIAEFMSSGMDSKQANLFKNEVLQSLGMPAHNQDLGYEQMDSQTKTEELSGLMGD